MLLSVMESAAARPGVAYATVYPIAMVFLILIIQVIASAVY